MSVSAFVTSASPWRVSHVQNPSAPGGAGGREQRPVLPGLRAYWGGPGWPGRPEGRNWRIGAGCADLTPEAAAAADDRLFAERAAAPAEDLVLADDVDVVHICTPNHLHPPPAMRALSAGTHAICEKPLATDVDVGTGAVR